MKKSSSTPNCSGCPCRLISVFTTLEKEEIAIVEKNKSCIEIKKGERIFEQGEFPRGLFVVNKGKLKVVRTGSEGKEQIVHLAKDGDIMGYRAILGHDKYSCSGIALENSILCFIPSEIFISLIEKNGKLALNIIKLFSNELKEAEKNIANIAQKSVRERMAQTLLLIKGTYGFEADKKTLNVKITRDDFAGIAGTTRETATRVLQDFFEEKIIDLKEKKIKIINDSKLLETAKFFDK